MFDEKIKQTESDITRIKQIIRENDKLIKQFKEQNRKIDELLRRMETFEFNRL